MQYTGAIFTPIIGYLIEHLGINTTLTITASWILAIALICSYFIRDVWD